jgi:hypothetical protein
LLDTIDEHLHATSLVAARRGNRIAGLLLGIAALAPRLCPGGVTGADAPPDFPTGPWNWPTEMKRSQLRLRRSIQKAGEDHPTHYWAERRESLAKVARNENSLAKRKAWWRRVWGIEPTVRMTVQGLSSSKILGLVYAINTSTGDVKSIPVGRRPHGLTVWPQPGRYCLGHTDNMR